MAQLKEQWKTEKLCQRCVRVLSFQGEPTVNQSSCKKMMIKVYWIEE